MRVDQKKRKVYMYTRQCGYIFFVDGLVKMKKKKRMMSLNAKFFLSEQKQVEDDGEQNYDDERGFLIENLGE